MIRSFDGKVPEVAESAYVDEAAVVIGDVVVGEEASVWPNATLRGDSQRIVVGERANVQDNAVLHENTVLERNVTVGHSAIVHGATVAEGAMIGINAVVLEDAHVGENAVVGAGAVVTEGTEIPPAMLALGAPAEPKTELDPPPTVVPPERYDKTPAETYVELGRRYEETSERVD